MSEQEKLDLLKKEADYYENEVNWKKAKEKHAQILAVFTNLNKIFEDDQILLTQKESGELLIKDKEIEGEITFGFDYSVKPSSPRLFSVKLTKDSVIICSLKVRLMLDDSNLDKPIFREEPADSEVLTLQKNIKYFKEYIDSEQNQKWNFVCLDKLSDSQEVFETVSDLYDYKIRHLFTKN